MTWFIVAVILGNDGKEHHYTLVNELFHSQQRCQTQVDYMMTLHVQEVIRYYCKEST